MSRYRLTLIAKADLRTIRGRIAQHNPAAADRVMEAIKHRLRLASGSPSMGEAREDLGPGYRLFSVGNYNIVFRPVKGGIQVLRVFHGAQDYESLF